MNPQMGQLMQLMQIMKGGGNPSQMLSMMARQNPQVAQVMQMAQGKKPDQLKQMATNFLQSNGMDINTVMQQMGMK